MDKFETLKLYLAGIFLEPNFGVERITKFICDVDAHGMTGWSPSPYQFRLFPKRAGLCAEGRTITVAGGVRLPTVHGSKSSVRDEYFASEEGMSHNLLLLQRFGWVNLERASLLY